MWAWLLIQVPWWWTIVAWVVAWVVGVIIAEVFATRRYNRLMAAYRAQTIAMYDTPPTEEK